jgi:organic hydroperoxide reductase OsmC/OhrA
MTKKHSYTAEIRWTGNRGEGTAHYRAYDRTWSVTTPGKPEIACSNDPLLGGDPSLHNPEDLLLSSVASCHMLWFLHLASEAGLTVSAYADRPQGAAELAPSGAGRFTAVTLCPQITLAPGDDPAVADAVHARIHEVCFIARSVAFPISISATYDFAE